ncbi:MAG: lytic transglycosylase domain-containing protein [Bacteriovorax sp.]|nr:lytic transglycosylase domain-containing protein [Bacteriovorax sp.]
MKILKGALLFILVGALWSTSSLVKSHRLNQLVASGKIPYGPIPNAVDNYYSYNGLNSAFNSNLELKRADEFSKVEFEKIILDSLDPVAKQNFQKYLLPTLNLSVDYQIDPFWIISVMMVESGFNFRAQSHKNAHGLMQIRPDTASHLYQLMNKKVSADGLYTNLHHPTENIEVGIFYLKKLLQNFRMNYRLATIAYNVGPNKLKNLLDADEIDTVNFSYLAKVQDSYKDLTKNFAQELKKRPRPFEMTYVVSGQGRILEERLLKLYTLALPSFEGAFLLSSENLVHNSSHSLPF